MCLVHSPKGNRLWQIAGKGLLVKMIWKELLKFINLNTGASSTGLVNVLLRWDIARSTVAMSHFFEKAPSRSYWSIKQLGGVNGLSSLHKELIQVWNVSEKF